MPRHVKFLFVGGAIVFVTFGMVALRQAAPAAQAQPPAATSAFDSSINQNAQRLLEEGRKIFRYDTFGSEEFWGGKLRLHEAIVGQKLGGVGPGVSPKMALSLGLKVDAATVKAVLTSWGPGRYDAELNMDGKAKRPDGKSAATMMPSAFGLAGVNEHTWTGGWGTVTYWNAYVANTQMYGKGTFIDSRLNNAKQYPVAAKAGWGRKRDKVDMITAKLPALHFYQLAMPTPKAPAGSFDAEAAKRGEALFTSTAKCSTCHVPPIFTEPGYNLHTAEEIGIDSFQADRGPDRRYVTTPLRALFDTQKIHKGGFYHDGRFPTLEAVVNHYDRFLKLKLTAEQKRELIEYLKSI